VLCLVSLYSTLENDVCMGKNGTEFRRTDGNECSVLNEGDMWGFSMCHIHTNHINYLEYLFACRNRLYMEFRKFFSFFIGHVLLISN